MKAYKNFYFGAIAGCTKVLAKAAVLVIAMVITMIVKMVKTYKQLKAQNAKIAMVNTMINYQAVPWSKYYGLANGYVTYNF